MNNSTRIAIINYKAGNITSVKNSLEKIDYSPKIITNGKDLIKYKHHDTSGALRYSHRFEIFQNLL